VRPDVSVRGGIQREQLHFWHFVVFLFNKLIKKLEKYH
jgi:hypothetical protein